MRNKYITAFAILLTIATSSCSDSWLDVAPTTSVETERAIENTTDADYALNGIYNTMQSYEYYGARMMYYGDVTGEDAQAYSNTKRCADFYMFQYNKDKVPSSFWKYPYKVIRLANNILAAKPDALTDDIVGQALALRALALFDVTKVYGSPYTKDAGKSWGGVILLQSSKYDVKPRRSTVAECYTQILADLTKAVQILENKAKPGKLNQAAAKVLLARVYLYKGDFDNALKTAEDAISSAEKIGYRLWKNEEYLAGWKDKMDIEVLFKIVNTATDNAGNESLGGLYHDKGYKDIILSDDYLTLMKADTKDIRYALIEGKYFRKYLGNGTDEDFRSSDIPVFRLSEAYLIASEAAIRQTTPDNDKAIKYLDAIVKRGNPTKSVSGTITLAQILTERRKELMGEGHRFFDAMRNGLLIERKGKSHLSALTPAARSYDWNYFKTVLPVPKSEMDANENMRDQQNSGY